jgi:hypothetical protein
MKPLAGQVTFRGILGIFWSPTAPSEVAGVVCAEIVPHLELLFDEAEAGNQVRHQSLSKFRSKPQNHLRKDH